VFGGLGSTRFRWFFRQGTFALGISAHHRNHALEIHLEPKVSIVILVVATLFLGMVLGSRFHFVILLPVTGLGAICALIIGIAQGNGGWAVAVAIVILAIALQLGYLAGAMHEFSYPRGGGTRSLHLPATASVPLLVVVAQEPCGAARAIETAVKEDSADELQGQMIGQMGAVAQGERQKPGTPNGSSEQIVKDIRRATRKRYEASREQAPFSRG
jgi:hypothetical protein